MVWGDGENDWCRGGKNCVSENFKVNIENRKIYLLFLYYFKFFFFFSVRFYPKNNNNNDAKSYILNILD